MKSPPTPHPSTMLTLERFGLMSSASAVGTAVGAVQHQPPPTPQQPGQTEAIVALLALMVRGLLEGAPSAGVNA